MRRRRSEAVSTRTQAPSPLLEFKLRPPRRYPHTISRATLVERKASARRAHVVVIEAGPGYGKTTLAAEWLHRDPRRHGWYTVDGLDDDPIVFLTYVATLLGRCGANTADTLRALRLPNVRVDVATRELARAFAALPEPALLVFDNVHLLSPRPHAVLQALLAATPAGTQVVLVSRQRVDQPDGVSALRLDEKNLRMSDAEATALLEGAGLELDLEEAHLLNDYAEGWAAGLYLLALAGRPAFDRLRDPGTSGVDRFVADYLRLELLERLTSDERDFLTSCSVVEFLSGPLCDRLLDGHDSAAKLQSLADTNRFVAPLDDGWYRLHTIFRDLLRSDLELLGSERARLLTSRAADWFEENADYEAAIECAISAGDRERVASLVPRAAQPVYWSGRAATIERWLVAIDDPRLLSRHPAAVAMGTAMAALAGRPEMAERWSRLPIDDVDAVMPDGSPASAWIAICHALLCLDGVETMRNDALSGVASLAPGSRLGASSRLFAAFAFWLSGEADEAEAWLVEALDVAAGLGADVSASIAAAALALLALDRTDLRRAADFAARAQAFVDHGHLETDLSSGIVHAAVGRVALATGSTTAAREAAERASDVMPKLGSTLPWLATSARLELARLQLGLANAARARELCDEIDEILVKQPSLGIVAERSRRLRRDLDAGRSEDGTWAGLLTPAELRLVPLLASHLSFREIALRLDISRNTVKTQAIAVYRKLNVSSRSDAVERARGLGILSGNGAG